MTNWQTKKLGDVMEFVPTGAHSRNDMAESTNDKNEVFNIHYGDIHTKYATYVDFNKNVVPVLKDSNIRTNMLLQDGDLVVADASEDYAGVGSAVELVSVNNHKVIGGLHTFALRSKDHEFASGFSGIMLSNPATHKRLMRMSVYSKVYGLTKSSIGSVEISYPEKPEQQRIVAVLEVWDEYIEKLERKIALKEQLKKGLMQQLLTGKRRLPGFSGEWREDDIQNLFELKNGYTPSKRNPDFWENGTIPWFRMEDIRKNGRILGDSIQKITPRAIKNGGLFPAGSIIMSTTATIGEHALLIADSLANQQFTFLVRKVNCLDLIDPKFVFYYCYILAQWCKNNVNEGGLMAVDIRGLKKYKFPVPDITEQREIVKIMDGVSEDIDKLKEKKNLLVSQKKYLLKNLITGTIRTPHTMKLFSSKE